MISSVKNLLLSNGIDPSCDRLLVGLSGGADSVALALLLRELGFDMVAAHCNFHLRGEESVRDECFVRNFCQRYKIALECISFDTYEYAEMHALSIEMAARDLRYTWFEQLRTNHRLSYIAVAHHLDDNVETVLLNLIRGTGLNGLCAMPLVRENFVLRPLINVTKQQILDYLKLKGQSFCTDSTNVDTQFKRNKVRHELIPLLKEFNPSVIDGISRMIENLQGVRLLLDTYLMPDKKRLEEKGVIDIRAVKACLAPVSYLFELLNPYGFSREVIEEIARDIDGQSGAVYYSSEYQVVRGSSELRLSDLSSESDSFEPMKLDISSERGGMNIPCGSNPFGANRLSWKVIDRSDMASLKVAQDTFLLPLSQAENVYVRSFDLGERMKPFGLKGSKKISQILKDRKVPLEQRPYRLVLSVDDTVAWLLGEVTSDKFMVKEQDKEIVVFTLESISF